MKNSDHQTPLPLVAQLCQMLAVENISYCHWKSNNALDRSATGENDLDLLVSRKDILRFKEILSRLGFKRAYGTAEKNIVGIVDYYGYDSIADKIIHVHSHYQLVVGHDMTKNLRLPIEDQYIRSARQEDLFKVPAPEYEMIVFIIRMILKHLSWEAVLGGAAELKNTEQMELKYLQAHTNHEQMMSLARELFPFMDAELFGRCMQALQPGSSTWFRLRTGQKLQAALQTGFRRGLIADFALKLWRRVISALRWRLIGGSSKRLLEGGGVMIALVGGDGAGKSTAVNELYSWLSKNFKTIKMHMGRPPRSWTTVIVRGIIKIGHLLHLYPAQLSMEKTLQQRSLVSPGFPWLIREVCTARDRYMTYVRAQRFSAKGAIVIFDRFPISPIQLMDAPQTKRFISQLETGTNKKQFLTPRQNNWLVQRLINLEHNYYRCMITPEVLIVLRVNPDIAVQRKTNENPVDVRRRSDEVWKIDWSQTTAYLIDSAQPQKEMLSQIKTFVWSKL